MRYLVLLALVFQLNLYAQEKEGDLQLPVTDLDELERQEEELPPHLNEVEMKQKVPRQERRFRSREKTIEKLKKTTSER